MKHFPIIFMLFLHNIFCNAQDQLIKDIDFDTISDTVIINRINSTLEVKLSTQNFTIISSRNISFEEANAGIEETKSGFKVYMGWMRGGYASQFRYSKIYRKIQLIGMNRWQAGPANNDGSGESSVNLLTGLYIGNWNYFDETRMKLIKIKTIKAQINFPLIYLENFNNKVTDYYQHTCDALSTKYMNLSMQKRR